MDRKNYELHYLNREKLAEQGIDVPDIQPFSFVDNVVPKVNDELRNGLDVKTKTGSPVFVVTAVTQQQKDGVLIDVVELKFDRIDPTPYSKVPVNN
jgi:hypothetical protein